jgi:LAO/AO transport system kinase
MSWRSRRADGENIAAAQRARQEYESALHVLRSGAEWSVPVSTCSARDERGLTEVWEAVLRHRSWLEASGAFEARRAEQRVRWMQAVVHAGLERTFERAPGLGALRQSLENDVREARRSPTAAAYELLAEFWREMRAN